MLHYFFLLPLLGLITNLLLGVYVLRVNPRQKENRLFFLLAMALAFWSFLRVMVCSVGSAEAALFWSHFGSFGATSSAVLILHFFMVFTRGASAALRKYILLLVYPIALALVSIDLTTNALDTPPVRCAWGYASGPGPMFLPNVLFVIGCIVTGLFFAVRYYFRSADDERKQALMLIVAISFILMAGILTEVIPRYLDTMIMPPLTTTSTTVMSLIIVFTMRRYNLLMPLSDRIVQVEDALRENQKRLSSIVNGNPIPTVVLDSDHCITHWNRSLEELSGIKASDIIGTRQQWRAFYDEARPVMADLILDGKTDQLDLYYQGKYQPSMLPGGYEATDFFPHLGPDGKWLFFTACPLYDEQGRVTGAMTTLQDITDRMLASEKIQEQEIKYRLLAENANDVIWTTDLNLDFTYVSPSVKKLRGYSADEALRQTLEDILTPASYNYAIQVYTKAFGSVERGRVHESMLLELEQRCKDGSTVWTEVSLSALHNSQGKLAGIFGITRNIADRKKAEMELRASEEMFRLLAENANDVIWTADMDLNYSYISPSVERVRGYTPEEALALSLVESITPESLTQAMELFKQRREDALLGDVGQPIIVELEVFCKDGSTKWMETVANWLRDENDEINGLLGVSRDITERKKAEERLRRSEEQFRLLAENANDVIWTMDMNMQFTYISPSVKQVRGYTPEEVMALPPEKTFTPQSHVDALKLLNEAIDRESRGEIVTKPYRLEVEEYSRDGSTKWMELNINWLRNAAGEADGIIGISRDITERKKAEQELKTAKEQAEQANQAKSQFLTNISHEIRTPMNGVLGMVELLKTTSLTEEQADYAHTIYTSASSLLAIINDILDLSRIEAGHVTIQKNLFNLSECVDDVVSLLNYSATQKNLSLTATYDAPEWVISDKVRIRQILMNLVGNAVKFTDQGGVTVHVAQNKETDFFEISVTDTGMGIPEEMQGVIFESFRQADGSTTRRYEGTGLGLTISKNMAELMGGYIEVASREGEGSTFTVHLPLTVGSRERVRTVGNGDQNTAPYDINYVVSGLSALVVEDNPVSRVLLEKLLTKRNCQVDVVDNGMAALDMLRQKAYDVVFMDIQMPGPDGYQTLRAIRDPESTVMDNDVPVVAVTAHSMAEERERCIAAGMTDYIEKPVTGDKLDKILADVAVSG